MSIEIITLQGRGELPQPVTDNAVQFDMWRKMTEIVESHDDPGTFSALIGYEWTSNYGGGNNLHRNVIYRDGKALADRVRPLTTFDTENPEELWDWMAGYEAETGGRLLAIPHNGNLSNGLMFAVETFDGGPLTSDWAATRARWEPLYEVTQGKGTSEQHPSLAPADEFADFEIWDKGNLNVVPKEPGMIPFEYAREALKNGLAIEAELGANPFKFGLVGSTDAHTGISSAEENNSSASSRRASRAPSGPSRTPSTSKVTKLYSDAGTLYTGTAYAGSEPEPIDCPHLCLFGMATPEQFWRAFESTPTGLRDWVDS